MKTYFIALLLLFGFLNSNAQDDDDPIYPNPELAARCPYNWADYLAMNIKYPQVAKDNGVEGKVYVRFVVEKTGDITGATVMKGKDLEGGLPKEALRIVRNMPKWIPAIHKQGFVRSYVTVPLNFKLVKPGDSSALATKNLKIMPSANYNYVEYIKKNVKRSIAKKADGKLVVVNIYFTVDESGNITEVSVKTPSPDFKGRMELIEEIVRVAKLLPPWQPAMEEGIPIKSRYSITVNFGTFYLPSFKRH